MVETFVQPDNTSQSPSVYKAAIDAGMAVLAETARAFAPHESSPAAMNVTVDSGRLFAAGAVVSQAQQVTGTITAPATNPRIDRIVVDATTGAVSVIAGAENVAPTAPAITAGKLPVARVTLVVGQTAIENDDITDERGPLVSAMLDALARLSSNGLVTRTAAGTVAARSVAGTANQIAVTNGDAVAGNPTIAAVTASQGEAEAGTDTTKLMTAERTAQAIAVLTEPGGLVPLATVSASGASEIDFEGLTGYDQYIVIGRDIVASGSPQLRVRIKESGSYQTGNNYFTRGINFAGTAFNNVSDSAINITGSQTLASTAGFRAMVEVRIDSPSNTARYKTVAARVDAMATSSDSVSVVSCGAYFANTNAVAGIRIFPSTGTLTGEFTIYGRVEA